ncbi:MAG: tetratricopeptide repeat protein [Hydrococcus sp. C42_A2020_068]|uniref:tetratricopeptide repeat protein n=1 Tax=Pleurocapsa sp. PCC 7327 TaxID=118163 RepID=UPI00029F8FED|nr:tetratricopeptide repeat protein [Pleurocapsa sp. PCC 7327]AFY78628.1 cytochrome c biogenesis factor [Pleurocapsa sp. PCC 7327]MBF2018665.1 tetratricopeptide repeat protein [Hydrococcus sp. C42_A2020_068]
MILAFTLLIALSIPSSFRIAKVHAKLRQELRQNPLTDRENLLPSIFGHLKQLGYGNLPHTQKSVLVKELIQRHYESRADWRTRVFLSAIYLGSLFGGVAGAFGAISPHWIGLLSSYFKSSQQTRDRITQERQQEIDRATEALRRNPNDVDAYLKRAQMYTWLGKDREALADYDCAVSLKPDDISSRLNRASFRAKLEDSQGAIEDYDYVLRLEPHNIQTYYSRAQLRNEIGDYRRAFDDYNTIIQFHPKDSWAYVKRGYVRQQLGDYKGALVDANRAIALEPELPDAYALRSEVRRRLGDKKGALADEKKADDLYETSKY